MTADEQFQAMIDHDRYEIRTLKGHIRALKRQRRRNAKGTEYVPPSMMVLDPHVFDWLDKGFIEVAKGMK